VIATALLDAMLDPFVRALAPPPRPRGLLEFARSLKISTVDPDTGADVWLPYDPESHGAQFEVLRAFAAGGFLEMVVLGPVRDGKTTVTIVIGILYCLVELRQSCSLMLPTSEKAKEVWQESVMPVIEHSGLGWIMPDQRAVGTGGRGGTGASMLMATGCRMHLVGAGGLSQAAQSGYNARFAFADEASKISSTMLRLGAQRQAGYDMHGRFLRTTTLRDGDRDPSWLAFQDSTAGRFAHRCPRCVREGHPSGGWQVWTHERMTFDRSDDKVAYATARLGCIHNPEHLLTEDERRESIRQWRVVGKGQTVDAAGVVQGALAPSMSCGLLWTCFDSPLKSLGKIAIEWRGAEMKRLAGDEQELKILFHENFVFPWKDDEASDDGRPPILHRAYLVALSDASTYGPARRQHVENGDSHHACDCPAEVQFLTVATDVQRGGDRSPGRIYYLVQGWHTDGRCWDVAWGHIICSPAGAQVTEPELHDGLDRMHTLALSLGAEFARPLGRRGVDVGDHQDWIRRWLVRHPDWRAIKGIQGRISIDLEASDNFDVSGWIYRRRQDAEGGHGARSWWLYLVDVDLVRSQAQAGFLVAPGKPGAHHVPRGLVVGDALVKHYCATALIADAREGVRWSDRAKDRVAHPEYQPRHDFLDCRTYGHAMAYQYIRVLTSPKAPPRKYGLISA
jgi:hypothetical protein